MCLGYRDSHKDFDIVDEIPRHCMLINHQLLDMLYVIIGLGRYFFADLIYIYRLVEVLRVGYIIVNEDWVLVIALYTFNEYLFGAL